MDLFIFSRFNNLESEMFRNSVLKAQAVTDFMILLIYTLALELCYFYFILVDNICFACPSYRCFLLQTDTPSN
jgi:hypothetical protein